MNKIWHKPLHERKVWKQMTLSSKIMYYMRPFMDHFVDVWLQPLPFPTILKCAYSSILFVFLMLPILYPIIIIVSYYAAVQYFVESDLGIRFQENFDLIHYVEHAFTNQIPHKQCEFFVQIYFENCRFIIAACASCVDYLRLASALFFV